jgi:hypothetical protein
MREKHIVCSGLAAKKKSKTRICVCSWNKYIKKIRVVLVNLFLASEVRVSIKKILRTLKCVILFLVKTGMQTVTEPGNKV